jgi:SSS family transporter
MLGILDWTVLILTLAAVLAYGIYKSRSSHDLEGYLMGNHSMPWYLVLLGIMGTQASAITYLTGPGQAYSDGMRFVQYYFGLPLAMIVISIFFVPVYNKLRVYTAYEFLEQRFDGRTRGLTAFLFLLSRGLSTGISIFAPSLVLSSLMGWNIYYTNLVMGGLLIIYTMGGGATAVAHTQKLQMIIIFASLMLVGWLALRLLPGDNALITALTEAGKEAKLNIISFGNEKGQFDWKDKYNIWSGLIGGFFLSLSYFGTDHSQVGRYITAKDIRQSRMGLIMNGFVKIPMQVFILLLGVLIFSFYRHASDAPVFFDTAKVERAMQTSLAPALQQADLSFQQACRQQDFEKADVIRKEYKSLLQQALPGEEVNDNNYVFLHFAIDQMPKGLIGLVLAIIFLSAWGSIAAALHSLAASSVVDFHKRYFSERNDPDHDYRLSRRYTLGWGLFCVIVAMFANNIGNSLIEAVNILGSIFYGVILGIFLVALFFKRITAKPLFYAAIVSELAVLAIYFSDTISFLWLNAIGCILVLLMAYLLRILGVKDGK